ncbi:MAG: type II toxin-antitoxin system antitoxin, RelB/DinJ family [Candidatus Taylorbacteria bacterium]|nr:type II toxin-antitoxin system antitoxin, RelB/DinJ family [Candidatus Taylorbacteria bacterium]
MNTKTLLTVKTDKNIKKAAKDIAEELGIPLGTLVNAFLRQFIRTKEVTLSSSLMPKRELIFAINESEREFMAGKSIVSKDLKELRKNLRAK